MIRTSKAVTLLLATALVAASCGKSAPPGQGSSPTPNPRPSSTGSIKITDPQPGQTIQGTTYKVKVEVTGARIIEQASTDVRPDTGHLHLSLDGNTVTLLAGLEFELKDLTPGQHLLQAELAAADHGPFQPRVIATVTFNVE